jgi:hypothetical protein
MPSIERKNLYPNPPPVMTIESIDQVQEFADNVQRHLSNVALYEQYRRGSLLDVFNDEIDSVSVDKLTAGSILVDSIFLKDSKFAFDGVNQKIIVKDESATTRVEIGRFGAGTSYGIQIRDASNNLIVDIGGLGTNTVGTGQIIANSIQGTHIQANTIDATKLSVSQLSAITADMGSVTAGTITGALIRTGTGNPRIELTTTTLTGRNAAGTVIFDLQTGGTVRLGPSTGNNILWNGTILVVTGDIIAGANINTGAVTETKIGTGAVTNVKIGAGAVTAAKIQANTITANEIAATTITASEIASNAITTIKINAGAVDATKISVSTLSAISANMGTITAGTISAGTVNAGTITTGTLALTSAGTSLTNNATGNVTFSNGADIILKSATSGDSSMIKLQTSGGSDRLVLRYNQTSNTSVVTGAGSTIFNIGGSLITIGGSGADNVRFLAQVDANIDPNGGNAYDLGDTTNYWRTLYVQTITSAASANLTLQASSGEIQFQASMRPNTNNLHEIGNTTRALLNVWSTNYPAPSHSSLKTDIRDLPEDVKIPRGIYYRYKEGPRTLRVGYLADDLPKASFVADKWADLKAPIGVLCTVARRQEKQIKHLQEQLYTLQSILRKSGLH